MAEFVMICERCGKKFITGMLKYHVMRMQYMGIDNLNKVYELVERERELAYNLYESKRSVDYKMLYLAVTPQNCPYCNADRKYFREEIHFP